MPKRCSSGLVLILLLLAVCSGGCGGSTSPSPVSVSGTWTGSVASNRVGAGVATVTLNQSGSSLTGTWAAAFPDPSNNDSGSLSGTVSGSGISATLTSSVPGACPYSFTATVNGNQMSGTYATFNCTVAAGGNINLTRQ